MGLLSKKYRLIWIKENRAILNDYKKIYSDSVTIHPDESPNEYFESDNYQDILDKIRLERLVGLKDIPPPPQPES